LVVSTGFQISDKNLGQLALPTFCPRCFWIRMRCEGKLPWLIFPGIFSSLDNYQKKIANLHFERHLRIPKWLDDFGDLGKPIKVPGHKTFNTVDPVTNIRLTGVPDEILRRDDSLLFVADHKTARFTGNQDELLPMYVTQLNSYSLIAERIGLCRVHGLGLIYYQPATNISVDDIDSLCAKDGFSTQFVAKLLPIELRPSMIPPLLARVREICDMEAVPAGREGCEDCERLERVVQMVRPHASVCAKGEFDGN
jgi:hypothetical protein